MKLLSPVEESRPPGAGMSSAVGKTVPASAAAALQGTGAFPDSAAMIPQSAGVVPAIAGSVPVMARSFPAMSGTVAPAAGFTPARPGMSAARSGMIPAAGEVVAQGAVGELLEWISKGGNGGIGSPFHAMSK